MRYIEIFRHLLSKCFKNAVLGVKKWCSANISSDNKQKYAEKFIKSESFLAVLRVDIIFNVKWVEVRKTSEILWVKLYCKMCDLFCQFLLALRLSARKSEIKKNSDDVHWNVWTNIKTLYARNDIFKKRIPNMTFWIIYVLVWISFLWTGLGYLAKHGDRQNLSWLAKHGGRHLYSTTPLPLPRHHRKASYGSEKSSSFHNHFPQSTTITRTHYNYFPPLYWYK